MVAALVEAVLEPLVEQAVRLAVVDQQLQAVRVVRLQHPQHKEMLVGLDILTVMVAVAVALEA